MGLKWRLQTAAARTGLRLLRSTGWFGNYFGHWRGAFFEEAQAAGLHVLPVHFYSPVPDTRSLPDSLWAARSEVPGVELNLDRAVTLVNELGARYGAELDQVPDGASPEHPQRFHFGNMAYAPGEAAVLYGLVRHLKPRKIIELGAGNTTLLIAQALRANRAESPERPCEFVSVDPYPPSYLFPPLAEVTHQLRETAQGLPMERFTGLGADDILFIDSSHVVTVGSDVVRLVLEVLPRLAPGVVVHIHDIFLPLEYPREWTFDARFFWNEQYLVQAFLACNTQYEVLVPVHALQKLRPGTLEQAFGCCRQRGGAGASLWLRRR